MPAFDPALVIVLAAGLESTFLQNAPRLVLKRIQPDLARISLANGWRRIFGSHGRTEFLKSVAKLISVTLVLWVVLRSQINALTGAMLLDPDAIPGLILMIATRLLTAVCAHRCAACRGPRLGACALAQRNAHDQAGD